MIHPVYMPKFMDFSNMGTKLQFEKGNPTRTCISRVIGTLPFEVLQHKDGDISEIRLMDGTVVNASSFSTNSGTLICSAERQLNFDEAKDADKFLYSINFDEIMLAIENGHYKEVQCPDPNAKALHIQYNNKECHVIIYVAVSVVICNPYEQETLNPALAAHFSKVLNKEVDKQA